jgi:hypothetical protein
VPRQLQPVRTCTRCGSSTNEFYRASKVSDGKSSWCKPCFRDYRREQFAADPEFKAQRYGQIAEWAKLNPEKVVAKTRRWQQRNPGKCERVRSRRHLSVRTPRWANRFFIQEAYDLARRRSKMLGEPWEVHHIVPLYHPLVCGLHVETNLSVIPARVNRSIGNAFPTQ